MSASKQKHTTVSNSNILDLNDKERPKPLSSLQVFFSQKDDHEKECTLSDESLPSQLTQKYIRICLRKKIGAEVETDKVWFHYKGIFPKSLRVDVGLFGRLRKAYANTDTFDLTHKNHKVTMIKKQRTQATTTTTTTTATKKGGDSDNDSDSDNKKPDNNNTALSSSTPGYDHVVLRPDATGVKRKKDKRYPINN